MIYSGGGGGGGGSSEITNPWRCGDGGVSYMFKGYGWVRIQFL